MAERERWASRLGVILAVAGSAVGLGNFLRFPAKAAINGGGAFMIPYFVCLLFMGLPLMWMEWAAGRYAGAHGHTTGPGMCGLVARSKLFRYLGVLGLICPIVVFFYYTYIESWLLGYAYFAVMHTYDHAAETKQLGAFLGTYIGAATGDGPGLGTAYLFFLLTFLANFYFLWHGISGGIEKLCNWALPALFVMAIVVAARVLTLGAPDPANPDNSVAAGMNFLWQPDFSKILHPRAWLDAGSQIFFTLSVGFGVIVCYAAYVKRDDDVALSGLTATSLNEFAEVILGGSIVIPLAYAFLGQAGTIAAADPAQGGGTFHLGFVTSPFIFHAMTGGSVFALIWYLLLFLAGITSSVSLAQPAISFLKDELGLSRNKSVALIGVLSFACCQVAIFGAKYDAIDEMDFWASNFGILLFGLIEAIAFMWLFGSENAWAELKRGAKLPMPRILYYIMKYVTPLFIAALLIGWMYAEGWDTLTMANVKDPDKRAMFLAVRLGIMLLTAAGCLLIWRAGLRKQNTAATPDEARAQEVKPV